MKDARLLVWRVLTLLFGIAVWTISVSAQTETIIHTFTGNGDGGGPSDGALVRDANGNFYGTTRGGGLNGGGIVYELSPTNAGWTEQILYNFSPTHNGGYYPDGGVVSDGKGNLYGTTAFGGTNSAGTLFELTPASSGTWTEKVLYNFPGGSSLQTAFGSISFDAAGNIYGLAEGGKNGAGVAYELMPGSNGNWNEKILHTFTGKNDGTVSYANCVVLDQAGNVYGVAGNGPNDYGIVFELVHGSNGAWTEKILYAFTGAADGGGPYPSVVFDQAGNLYGAANFGIYKLTPQSNGTWTQNLIYTFKGGTDGAYPNSPLTIDQAGNLYGTTSSGGSHRGTVFQLLPGKNGTWSEKILHRFVPNGVDGVYPGGGLTFDTSGNLYGTSGGGASNAGIVFKITP
jgi:uncharacterized repeat protein (TIGR03803 family)